MILIPRTLYWLRVLSLGCFFAGGLASCISAPAKKAKDIACPEISGLQAGAAPLDAMPISGTEAILICGHREDTRTLAKRMRLSESAIVRANLATNQQTVIWQVGALDVRYVQLYPKEKRIEIIWPVFDEESKPIAVYREVAECAAGPACVFGPRQCVFKKNLNLYKSRLPAKGDLKKWFVAENTERRASALFLAAASGDKKSRDVLFDKKINKINEDGYLKALVDFYRQLLEDMPKICHQ